MRYCIRCGADLLGDDASFCPDCGAPVEAKDAVSSVDAGGAAPMSSSSRPSLPQNGHLGPQPPRGRGAGRWLLWSALGIAVLVGIGVGVYFGVRGDDTSGITQVDATVPTTGAGVEDSGGVETTEGGTNDGALFPARSEDGLGGYIDQTGAWVIQPQFRSTFDFSEGLAAVSSDGETMGYIDRTGAWVIQPQFRIAGGNAFSEGLAVVLTGDQLWGYIDKTGAWAIEPQFTDAHPFAEGRAAVTLDALDSSQTYGFIDRTGAMVIEPHFWPVPSFSEGLASVYLDVVGGGYIDRTGTLVIPMWGDDFSEGLASVGDGYIDQTGTLVIQGEFYDAGDFSEGLAAVRLMSGGPYGYIDRTGTVVIQPQFYDVYDFSEGLAAVTLDDQRWGYIDKTGAWVIEPQFEKDRSSGVAAHSFSNGLARVTLDRGTEAYGYIEPGAYGYIDKTGALIWPKD